MNQQPSASNGAAIASRSPSPSVQAGAAAQPRNLLRGLVPGFLESSMLQLAEDTFRQATREQLRCAAEFAVKIDRDKAIAFSALLAWSVAGDRPELVVPRNEFLVWVYLATPDEIHALGARLVELNGSGSALLASAITDAMVSREQTAMRRMRKT